MGSQNQLLMNQCNSYGGSSLAHTYQTFRVVTVLLSLLMAFEAFAQLSTYVVVRLPKNVSIELPRNWVVFSDNQRITLDAMVIARQQSAGVADFRHDLAFAANYYDDSANTAGMVNVRYYPEQTVTQSDAHSFSRKDIRDLDQLLQQELPKGVAGSRIQILAWLGTSRQTINGTIALVSQYRRSSPNGSFRVTLIRVLDASRSFTLTVSYREDQAYFLQPICEYVVQSLKR